MNVTRMAALYLRAHDADFTEITHGIGPLQGRTGGAGDSQPRSCPARPASSVGIAGRRAAGNGARLSRLPQERTRFLQLISALAGNSVLNLLMAILYDFAALASRSEDVLIDRPERVQTYRRMRARLARAVINARRTRPARQPPLFRTGRRMVRAGFQGPRFRRSGHGLAPRRQLWAGQGLPRRSSGKQPQAMSETTQKSWLSEQIDLYASIDPDARNLRLANAGSPGAPDHGCERRAGLAARGERHRPRHARRHDAAQFRADRSSADRDVPHRALRRQYQRLGPRRKAGRRPAQVQGAGGRGLGGRVGACRAQGRGGEDRRAWRDPARRADREAAPDRKPAGRQVKWENPDAPGVAIEVLSSGTTGTPKRIPLPRDRFEKAL